MEEIQEKLIKYLKNKNIYEETDFTKSNHSDICIELTKFSKIINQIPKNLTLSSSKIKNISNMEYILLSDASNYLKEINDVRNYYLIDIQEIFGYLKTFETNGFQLIKMSKIKLSGQHIFTYTLWKMLNKFFPNISIKIEENFLQRFDKKIIIHQTKGPRVDIIIDEIDIVIEYDEIQHSIFEHKEKDYIRDNAIRGHGFEVYRFTEGEDRIIFFKELVNIITERYILFNPAKYGDWIIDYFVKNKLGSKNMISLLTLEQVMDVINGVSSNEIGNTPRNIRLKKNIFEWLDIQDNLEQKKIIKLLDDIDGNYENDNENDDIILSPNTFEKLLGRIDANEYENISHIRDCYIKIKNKFMEKMYKDIIKFSELRELQKSTISYVINQAYERGIRDCSAKYKDLQKENECLKEKIKFLEEYINIQLPQNKRGFIKKDIEPITIKLIIGKSIVAELPELIYTGDMNDYINENKLGLLYEQNKKKYKDKQMKCLSKCIQDIKEKIYDDYDNNYELYDTNPEKSIYGCKIIYKSTISTNKISTQNNIIVNDDDNDEM